MNLDYVKCRKIITDFIEHDTPGNHVDDLLTIAMALMISGFIRRTDEHIEKNGNGIHPDDLLMMLKASIDRIQSELCSAIAITNITDENLH